MQAPQPSAPMPERVTAIDALRGFDMFWISGGQEIALALLAVLKTPMPAWFVAQFEHVKWVGFTAWDLIMPLFLFITGASIPYALDARRRQEQSKAMLAWRIGRRVVLLFLFGMMVQGNLLEFDLARLKVFSNTLQSIAVGYVVASLAQLTLRVRWQVALTAGLLVGYWALMMFVPAGGHAAGTLEREANLALYVDHLVLGRFEDGTCYTWVLSGMGFAATVMMGMFGGHTLRLGVRPAARVGILLAAGAGCLAAGWIWSFHFPLNKHLWTSSMALWAGGWCYLLLGVFYLVIDVWKLRRWALPFVVIGMNAITSYMAWHLLPFTDVSRRLLGGLGGHLPGAWGGVLVAVGAFALIYAVLHHLYRHRIFLKV